MNMSVRSVIKSYFHKCVSIPTLRFSLFCCTLAGSGVALAACGSNGDSDEPLDTEGKRPDSLPVMLNTELPFRYPPALYAEKVEGNVTLRLFIDELGAVIPESTQVVETSHTSLLDSAAVKGARDLKFSPAKYRGTAMAVAILFPIYFRHPEVSPPSEALDTTAPVRPAVGASTGSSTKRS